MKRHTQTNRPVHQGQFSLHKMRNMLHSGLLLAGIGGLLAWVGFLLVGIQGLLFGLAFWAFSALFSPKISAYFMLQRQGAYPIEPWEAPWLHQLVGQLAQKAELNVMPKLLYIPTMTPNAFAAGSKDEPILGITEGLLQQLDRRQLKGVLAHELSHIKNGDMSVMQLANSFSRLTKLLSFFGQLALFLSFPVFLMTGQPVPWLLLLTLIFAPTFASLLELALSRTREFDADLEAARLTNDPMALASALVSIENSQISIWERLFGFRMKAAQPEWLHSHPNTEERIRRLRSLKEHQEETPTETRRPQQNRYAQHTIVVEPPPPTRARRRRRQPVIIDVDPRTYRRHLW